MNESTAAKDKLTSDFGVVMDDIDSLVKATANKAEGEVSAIRERIRRHLDAARTRASDMQHEAFERARTAARNTDHYVHDHPWHAVGVGAAIGLLVGVLIGRR